MCGIAGIVAKTGKAEQLEQQLEPLLNSIAHRGPDGQGSYRYQNLILGHRRLAILDLSLDGQQPMQLPEAKISITYNGEIYNYLELRKELQALGYSFRTQTDTEVILRAYQHWGQHCVQKFNGMWAFVILDERQQVLFCSRDRFGVKPFYYIDTADYFVFCSEIKGLLSFLPNTIAQQDLVLDYLLTQKTDHQARCFFKNVHILPASHHLIYQLPQHAFYQTRYYELTVPSQKTDITDYCATLEHAVQLRLRSDVPVGTCLSGGLDSSTITAFAAQHYAPQQLHAITAISEQSSNNEQPYADSVVQHCKLHWHTITPSYLDFAQSLEQIMRTQEEPFASPSIAMQYFVMQTAKQAKIPVLLDGQGGDETLLGYERYQMSYWYHQWQACKFWQCLRNIRQAQINNHKLGWLQTGKYLLGTHFPQWRFRFYCQEHHYLKQNPDFPQHLQHYATAARDIWALQKLELEQTNLPALLRFEDKNSMAHSIETRLPFLDYRVVELALGLDPLDKLYQGWSKYILRTQMHPHLPPHILWRKNKFGFEAPEQIWLTQHQDQMHASILKAQFTQRFIKRNLNVQQLSARIQWRLYTIALWEKIFNICDYQ